MAKEKKLISFESIFEGNDSITAEAKAKITEAFNAAVEAKAKELAEDFNNNNGANGAPPVVNNNGNVNGGVQNGKCVNCGAPCDASQKLCQKCAGNVTEGEDSSGEMSNSITELINDPEVKNVIAAAGDSLKTLISAIKNGDGSDTGTDGVAQALGDFVQAILSSIKTDDGQNPDADADGMNDGAFGESLTVEEKEKLATQIDSYLQFACEKWISENQLAVDTGIKVEVAEALISKFKNIFTEFNVVNVPETDVTEGFTTKISDLETKLNEQITVNASLVSEKNGLSKEFVFAEACKGLAATQVEKFKKLAEEITFESLDDYKKKIGVIREQAFEKNPVVTEKGLNNQQGVPDKSEPKNTIGSMYSKAIDKLK